MWGVHIQLHIQALLYNDALRWLHQSFQRSDMFPSWNQNFDVDVNSIYKSKSCNHKHNLYSYFYMLFPETDSDVWN